jgi:hypothetical protein
MNDKLIKVEEMKSIQEIAKECEKGDWIRSHAWGDGLLAKIVDITDEGVLMEGPHLVNNGIYLAKFADHSPKWRTWKKE